MIPAAFDYVAPATLDEALDALRTREDAKVLSGGMSLIPLLKLRLASPAVLVDINRIPGLDRLEESDGHLHIGALVREAALETSTLVADRYPALADTARVVADPLVRNRATVVGNIAHGDPANDHPATMIALGALALLQGPAGVREVPVDAFYTGLFTTELAEDEIMTGLKIPAPPPGSGGAYVKMERKIGDYATAATAVQLTIDPAGTCVACRIGLTNVGFTPTFAREAGESLVGGPLDDDRIRRASELAAEAAQPAADRRGSVEYKKDLVRVLTGRAIRRAAARATG